MDVNLLSSNPLYIEAGLVYNKAYNVHKALWDTPLKGHRLFDQPLFETLAYSEPLLDEWVRAYRRGRARKTEGQATLRADLVAAFQKHKTRLRAALDQSARFDIGVRQEYRVTLALLLSLPPAPAAERGGVHVITRDGTPVAGGHRPYWVLSSRDVKAFVAMDCRRWLLAVEFLMAGAGQETPLHELGLSQREAEMLNGALLTAVLRILCTTVAGQDPARSNALYLARYPAKKRDRHGRWVESGRQRPGLGLRDTIERNGMAGLPDELMHWRFLAFRAEHAGRMAFFPRGLGRPFQAHRAGRLLDRAERRDGHLRGLLEPRPPPATEAGRAHARQDAFAALTQLIVHAFTAEVLGRVVQKDAERDARSDDAAVAALGAAVLQRLAERPDHPRYAHQSLTMDFVEWLLRFEVRLAQPKALRAGDLTRNNHRSPFAAYNRGDWAGKLQGLFDWDDDGPAGRPRAWHDWHFRHLTRQLYGLVLDVCGADEAERFRRHLGLRAARHVWIIPQYDHDKVAVHRKAYKHNAADTRDEIHGLGLLQRINWLAASVDLTGLAGRQLAFLNRRPQPDAQNRGAIDAAMATIRQQFARGGDLRV
jgi:hypothetical protein